MEGTKTTASIAGLSAIVVAALLTTKSSTTGVASLVHGTITSNMTNLATYTSAPRPSGGKYICSNQNLRCAFHHLAEEHHHLVEGIPWRDGQFHHSGSMPCSWEVQDNLERDDQILLTKDHISKNSGENNTPLS